MRAMPGPILALAPLSALFGQTFDAHDLAIIGLLIVLEGVLSIDNALVLGLLAKRLPKHQQGKALTYGLVGAFVFRIIAIAFAAWLLHWRIVKFVGGAYLVWVAVKHFFFERKDEDKEDIHVGPDGEPMLVAHRDGRALTDAEECAEIAHRAPPPFGTVAHAAGVLQPGDMGRAPGSASVVTASAPAERPASKCAKLWPTVIVIELTDIAFAVDSILAAIAMVPTPTGVNVNPKLWVVVTGGMLGVILMRVAAVIFIKLLERFPRFEVSAYLLVLVIGGKLVADWWFNTEANPHRLNFHDAHSIAFWVFWLAMLGCFLVGFIPTRKGRGPGAGAGGSPPGAPRAAGQVTVK
jgi:predicted tellurium resistance membrane protein TerC